jgi:hypothetical protein
MSDQDITVVGSPDVDVTKPRARSGTAKRPAHSPSTCLRGRRCKVANRSPEFGRPSSSTDHPIQSASSASNDPSPDHPRPVLPAAGDRRAARQVRAVRVPPRHRQDPRHPQRHPLPPAGVPRHPRPHLPIRPRATGRHGAEDPRGAGVPLLRPARARKLLEDAAPRVPAARRGQHRGDGPGRPGTHAVLRVLVDLRRRGHRAGQAGRRRRPGRRHAAGSTTRPATSASASSTATPAPPATGSTRRPSPTPSNCGRCGRPTTTAGRSSTGSGRPRRGTGSGW